MKQNKLAELSLKKRLQLFPFILAAHQDCWADWYKEKAGLLKKKLPDVVCISHIGSTAIKGICAKPIIDIRGEVARKEKLSLFTRCGWKMGLYLYSKKQLLHGF